MEILENALKTIPGLTLVFAIAALLLLEDNSELAAAIRVFVVAWTLYRISSNLDWFFDLAYGPGPRDADQPKNAAPSVWLKLQQFWCHLRSGLLPGFRSLEHKRDEAAGKLGLKGVKGLYGRAEKILKETDDWKTNVEPLRGFSKAARAFIVPLLLVSVMVSVPDGQWLIPRWFMAFIASIGKLPLLAGFRGDFARAGEKLEFLKYPAIPAVACLISLGLYLSLRLLHMNRMYDLVADKKS